MNIKSLVEFLNSSGWLTLVSFIANLALVSTLGFVIRQLIIMRRTLHAQAYSVAREILQDEKVRKERRLVFKHVSKYNSIDEWSKSERKRAQIVCHTYDSVGQMVKNHLLPKNIVIDNWNTSLIRCKTILVPLVEKYRRDWGAPELWDDFLWLAHEAERRNQKLERRLTLLKRLRILR